MNLAAVLLVGAKVPHPRRWQDPSPLLTASLGLGSKSVPHVMCTIPSTLPDVWKQKHLTKFKVKGHYKLSDSDAMILNAAASGILILTAAAIGILISSLLSFPLH